MTAFKRSTLAASLAALTFGLTATADDGGPDSVRARLSSYNEGHFIPGHAASPSGLTATADDGEPASFRGRLSSYNEVHFIAGNAAATPVVPPALRGAISSGASGSFRADIDERSRVIDYEIGRRHG